MNTEGDVLNLFSLIVNLNNTQFYDSATVSKIFHQLQCRNTFAYLFGAVVQT